MINCVTQYFFNAKLNVKTANGYKQPPHFKQTAEFFGKQKGETQANHSYPLNFKGPVCRPSTKFLSVYLIGLPSLLHTFQTQFIEE